VATLFQTFKIVN